MKMSALERTLLILVDGRQNLAALFAALGRQYPADDECRAALQRLVAIGLVTVQRETGPAGATKRRSLALARLYLIESVERALRGDTQHLKPVFLGVTDERLDAACHRRLPQPSSGPARIRRPTPCAHAALN
jgi:hypothetical protein